MNPHQILAVLVRLAAIWLFLYAVSTMMGSYVQANNHNGTDSLLPILIGLGIVALICSLLWFFPFLIAKTILPISNLKVSETPIFDNWFTLGCSLIGVMVLTKAIPALVSYFLAIYLGQKFFPGSFQTDPAWSLMVSFNVFQFLVGLWLFFGGKGLKKILHWARYS